jgi:hypothetical protein
MALKVVSGDAAALWPVASAVSAVPSTIATT